MVWKCSVPNCNGNYKNGPKVMVFSFPRDLNLRQRWVEAIKRECFVPTNSSRVCELHFHKEDIERFTTCCVESTGEILTATLKHPRLVQDAVPSILPGCPSYLSKSETSRRECPSAKRQKLECQNIQKALAESIETSETYFLSRSFSTLDEAYKIILDIELQDKCWVLAKGTHNICIFYIEENSLPDLKLCIFLSENLSLSINQMGVNIKEIVCEDGTKLAFPMNVTDINNLEKVINAASMFLRKSPEDKTIEENVNAVSDILCYLSSQLPEKKNAVMFLKEQINLLKCCSKNRLRYNWETLLFCSLLFSISPHAYKFLRNYGNLTIPSPRTIKNICCNLSTDPRLEQNDINFLQYVSSTFRMLETNDKTVVLMIDEIHIKPYMDYKSGNIVGGAYNESQCATSAHVFMIQSMLSSYKDVVHVLPVKTMKANDLYTFIRKVILGLEDIGFEVLCVLSDNNSINKKAMSAFATPPEILNHYTHPQDPTRPLFFLIDTVHIMKNIRNNWINKKPVQCMQYPNFDAEGSSEEKHASFDALKQLHRREEHQLIKYGYSLTLKALYPTTIEKQNVKIALQVFNHNIVAALRQIGPKVLLENYEDTADYIEIICRWWDIVNVKTLLKGQRLHNKFQEPITKNSAHIFQFLQDFLKWLDKWQSLDNSFGKLTKETHHAVRHTTDGLLKIVRYCLDQKNYSFVLPGKLQTDKLEERFGKYRRQAGAQYHVSVRQIFESESKLRMTSVLPLILKSKAYGDINITKEDILAFMEDKECEENIKSEIPLIFKNICATIDESDIDDIEDNIWSPLVYVAGYAAYSVSKKTKCDYCSIFLKSDESSNLYSGLITETSRGGLCYPSEGVILSVAYAYLILIKLLQIENDFLKQKNQKYILMALSFETIVNGLEIELFIGHSCPDHNEELLLKMLLHPVANILLKNYTKKHNDRATTRTMPHLKRIKP